MDHFYNHLAHAILIGPALVFIGMKSELIAPSISYKVIFFVGLFVLGYHLYRAFNKVVERGFASAWVNYIHILLVAPVLLALGYFGKETPRYVREILMMLGFAAIGYHALYLIK